SDQLRTFCRETGKVLFGRPILPRSPNDSSRQASTTVAYGSLVLLTDTAFITKRIITMVNCVAGDKDLKSLGEEVDIAQPIERDPCDGVEVALRCPNSS